MITNLTIKNIGIIDELSIELNRGFNVFTGETGAGKSLIIDALMILSGGRFSKEMIRQGQKNSYVEMALWLPKIQKEENIIVSREININGKNICKINGRMVTVTELKEFMKKVIDIHGQNENQSLLEVHNHIKILDKFAGEKLEILKKEYKKYYFEYLDIQKKISENFGDEKEKQRRIDLLKYELNEIEAASLKTNEEEELYEKRKLIVHAEKIAKGLMVSADILNQVIIDNLSTTVRELDKITQYNENYQLITDRLRNCFYEIQEAEIDLTNYYEEINFDENEQEKIESRIDTINSLKRKYGNTIEDILEFRNQVQEEIEQLENNEKYISDLKKEEEKLKTNMLEIAIEMSKIRTEFAKDMSQKINQELIDLEMKKAEFEVHIDTNENRFLANGIDEVELMISTNLGSEKKPLMRIASGGEMSRIMLAIKNVLADVDDTPIMVFDEIDTGISGNAGVVTGEKIKNISKRHQVICITHLASMAAKADYHYYIYKETNNNETRTNIKQLEEDEILREIARISSGSVTDVSLSLAKQLRKVKKIA